MKEFLNTDKSEKLKEVLLGISGLETYFEEPGMISKTLIALEEIYWQGANNDQYRHMYSDLFVIITQIDRSDDLENEILSQNLKILCKNYRPRNKDKEGNLINISKSLLKLYDHVNLDIARLNYSKAINYRQHFEIMDVASKLKDSESNIHNQISSAVTSVQEEYMKQIDSTKEEFNEQIKNKMDKVTKETEKMRSEYISILGIFASIVLAFTGGITFSTSVLSNIHKASIYRTVIITALIGGVLIFVLWLLMDFIKSVHGQTKRKYSFIIVPEVVLIIIIILTIVLFRYDYFNQEKINSIYEDCIEFNTEIEL